MRMRWAWTTESQCTCSICASQDPRQTQRDRARLGEGEMQTDGVEAQGKQDKEGLHSDSEFEGMDWGWEGEDWKLELGSMG